MQIIGFPEPIAQDLARWFDAQIVPADHAVTEQSDGVCLLDQAHPQSSHLIGLLTQAHRPTIILGTGRAAAQDVPFIQQCPMPCRVDVLQQMVERLMASHQAIVLGSGWKFFPHYRYVAHEQMGQIALTDKESDLLKSLYKARPQPIDKDQLLKEVWSYEASVDTHTLETHIYRLRSKLEPLKGLGLELVTMADGYALR